MCGISRNLTIRCGEGDYGELTKLRIILLDYDLTLMDNLIDFFDALNKALLRYAGKTITFNEFYSRFLDNRFGDITPENVAPEIFWRYFRMVYETRYGRPLKGAEEFLFRTKIHGLRNIIVSGRECHSRRVWLELERFGLAEFIDEVYTLYDLSLLGGAEEELFDKTWLIKYILTKYGASSDEAVFLGDYSQDYLSSMKAGVKFIGVSSYPERKKYLQVLGVKYIAEDLLEAYYILGDICRE